ncbi:MAG: hypothetical protein Kow00105_04310 [Phycisphaeraceae bacterium]
MPYDQIDPGRIRVRPLAERRSFISIEQASLDPSADPPDPGAMRGQIDRLADRINQAHARGASVMLVYGAHVIKNGCGRLINALLETGKITHLATQGAGIIHDWEFAYLGRSSESVRDNTPKGEFGTWDETGRYLNLAVLVGAAEGLGFGEAVGRMVCEDGLTLPDPAELTHQITSDPTHPLTAARADLLQAMTRFGLGPGRLEVPHPYKDYTVLAGSYRQRIPLTVHPGIGYDIITNHPMFHGGAIGRTSDTDTRIFGHGVLNLSGGVYLSVGSAIMSPQVFEKAMSLANNLLRQEGRRVEGHHIAVVDIQDGGGWDWTRGEPPRDSPAYYLRFCKSFSRMGGEMDYLCGDNRVVLAGLLHRLK